MLLCGKKWAIFKKKNNLNNNYNQIMFIAKEFEQWEIIKFADYL